MSNPAERNLRTKRLEIWVEDRAHKDLVFKSLKRILSYLLTSQTRLDMSVDKHEVEFECQYEYSGDFQPLLMIEGSKGQESSRRESYMMNKKYSAIEGLYDILELSESAVHTVQYRDIASMRP
jgi:hypothetical protein